MLLDRNLKLFLKTMSIAPESLVDDSPSQSAIMKELKRSEQVGVPINNKLLIFKRIKQSRIKYKRF